MPVNASESPFVTATTWNALGEGSYQGPIRPEWLQGRGAYGGMLGGAILRSMDFTAHFYAPLPLAHAAPDAFYLRTGHSRHAAHGYADDLAELWSQDGQLLAQLRQMAAIFPASR